MYRGKFEQMVVGRIRAALWAMYGKEKIAPRQWPEGRGMMWLEGEGAPTLSRTANQRGNRSQE
jgi:hypothetical protein